MALIDKNLILPNNATLNGGFLKLGATTQRHGKAVPVQAVRRQHQDHRRLQADQDHLQTGDRPIALEFLFEYLKQFASLMTLNLVNYDWRK